MPDLIPPHGGLTAPVNRTVTADRAADFRKEITSLPAFPVSDADLSSVYRLGDGGLSPLTGPMAKEAYDRVLRDVNIVVNGKKYAWSIPISLPATKDVADALKPGNRVKLVNSAGEAVGSLRVDDVFPWDKPAYVEGVYQTKRLDHPGGRMAMNDPGEYLVGGEVDVLPQPKHPEYGKYVLRPSETRALFSEKGWQRVVAFQTRNPLHRAHEYALVYGGEVLTRAGYKAGIVLNPLIGETSRTTSMRPPACAPTGH